MRTVSRAALRYVFPVNFTVGNGGALTVAPNLKVLIQPNVTLTDRGILTFGSGDAVTFGYAYSTLTQLVVDARTELRQKCRGSAAKLMHGEEEICVWDARA